MIRFAKNAIYLVIVLLAIWGLFSLYKTYIGSGGKEEVSSVVVLDRVEKVFKLVTVEGNFSEIYDYKHHFFADVWPFRKKALVRVKARVLVGYDLEDLTVQVDEARKTIIVKGPLKPEILSIEHDMDYYNFENGLFNLITNRDITEMGVRAKSFIEEKAQESDLFAKAEEQKNDVLELLDLTLQASGWALQLEEETLLN